ncbi:MAG: Gfo/Idh/MocA family oxidoreductase [Candidatus Thermoplasmatota archaeon]|nr:Gfo/Idh/MocA family oxidoreductase [Candidatus Thermoplasmatota archaeon]
MDISSMKVAVIGVGIMGGNHARVLSEISNLSAVCDQNSDRAREIGEKFSCRHYTSVDEMLDREELDAVIVATPTIYHLEEVEKCARRGIDLLVEKPIADTVENGQRIIDIAEEAGIILVVGMIERHNPIVKATKEIIDKDGLGQIVTLTSKRVSNYPARINDVGVITDLGVHDIDALRYLASSEVKSVYALGGSVKAKGLIDHANILLEFENGSKGIMEVSWLTPMKLRQVKVTGLKGYAEMDYIDQELKISMSSAGKYDLSDNWRIPQNYDIKRMRVAMEEPLKRELVDFLEACSDPNNKPLVSGPDGLKDLEVAKAAERSIETGEKVSL